MLDVRLLNGGLEKLLALFGFLVLLIVGTSLLIHYHAVYAGFEPGEVVGEVTLSLDSLPTAGLELDKDAVDKPEIAAESLQQEKQVAAPEPVEEQVVETEVDPEPEPLPEPEPIEPVVQEPAIEPEPVVEPPVIETTPVELTQLPEPEIVIPEVVPEPDPARVMPRPKPRPKPQVQKIKKPEPLPEPVKKKMVEKTKETVPVVPKDVAAIGENEVNAEEKDGNSEKASLIKTTDVAKTGKAQQNLKARQVAAVSGAGRKAKGDYWSAVRARLVRYKKYPRAAERRKIRGRVTFTLTLLSDGSVSDFAIVDSSGSRLLDRATKSMVSKASPFPPFPDDLQDAEMTKQLQINFKGPKT